MTNAQQKTKQIFTSSAFLSGAAITLTGILFCAFRAQLVSVLLTAVGAGVLLVGAAEIFAKRLGTGIGEIAAGVIIVILGWTVTDVALAVLGVIFIGYAIYATVSDLPRLRRAKTGELIAELAKPLLLLTAGALLIASKWAPYNGIFIAIGTLAIVGGILQIVTMMLKKQNSAS